MPDKTIWKAREIEILQLLAQGLTNNEIGARLHLASDTVRWYNKLIFEKLEVGNRTQAVKRASELNLLTGAERSATVHKARKSPVKYVANGGIHIAYQTIGDGPVDLLFIHGFLSNLELGWEDPGFASFFEALGKFARVILFDKRGVGLSDRIQSAPTLENTIEDAICVLNAVGSKRTFVLGTSEGGAAAVLLASTYPERVHGLILYASTPKLVRDGDEPAWAGTEKGLTATIESLQASWGGPWAIDNFAPTRAQDETFRAWWAKVLRASSSPSSIKTVIEVLRDVDIRSLLPQIRVRTLVVHKRGDRMVNVEAGRYFATHMPNAKFVELSGADHFYFVESDALISAIKEFCAEPSSEQSIDTWIATILYVRFGHTKQQKDMIQSELSAHHAKRSFLMEEDAIAVFDSPSRAVQCALKLREAIKDESLKISLHVGECSFEDGNPGAAVIEVARHAAELAPPGKILLTQTLHDILAGSGVVFDSRRIHFDRNKSERISFYTLA